MEQRNAAPSPERPEKRLSVLRRVYVSRWWDDFWQDFLYGLRTLRESVTFTTIAVLTLMLGIGANTALFSVVNGVLLNPLPYPKPDQLTILGSNRGSQDVGTTSYPNFLDWRKSNHSFDSMAAYREEEFTLTGEGEPERLRGDMVSSEFFALLGIRPVVGRVFSAEEDRVGGNPVALISAGFWKRRFGSSPAVLGRSLTMNGTDYEIVGVVPASLHFDRNNDVYIPIGEWTDPTFRDRRVSLGTRVLGRLREGGTVDQARADMAGVAHNLAAAYPEADKGMGITVVSLKKYTVGDIAPFLFVLLGAVGFVLLIACVNVANLLLAQASRRTQEFAIRRALGASPARVVRQLFTESVLLSLAGGTLGLIVAEWGTGFVIRLVPNALPRAHDITVDAHVLLFTLVISVAVGTLFGLAPARKVLRPDLHDTLKEGGRGLSAAKHHTQRILVVSEMAMALVLLVGAGLMFRSLAALWRVNPGFNPDHALKFDIAFPPGVAANASAVRALMRELHNGLAGLPSVEAASLTGGSLPMVGSSEVPFWPEGQPKPATNNEMSSSLFYLTEPDYLKTMEIPLERGRFFTPQDDEHSPVVTVIDENFAKKIFPNENPVGKRINIALLGLQPEIIGVVGHVKHWGSIRTLPIRPRRSYISRSCRFPTGSCHY